MKQLLNCLLLVFAFAACNSISLPTIIIVDEPSSQTARFAAAELRRYLWLRTGALAEITTTATLDGAPDFSIVLQTDSTLGDSDAYRLQTVGKQTLITGASDLALLYGSYRFAEHLGVRFYLHGDVVPDRRLDAFALPPLDETRRPLFATRGILPFHDFPEGPDWWTQGEYRAVLAQLPKLGMNFVGFHNYPETNSGPEPMVWFGLPDDVDEHGDVRAAYYAKHYYTEQFNRNFNLVARKTGDYSFGAADFFTDDNHAAEYQTVKPWNWGDGIDYRPEYLANKTEYDRQFVSLFNAAGDFFGRAFDYAHSFGVKVCIGTETPLYVPEILRDRLKEQGIDAADTATIRRLYEGALTWIKRNYSIDYYWLWTYEGWTWSGNSQRELDAVLTDMRLLLHAMDAVQPGFGLATAGWTLGSPHDRALFDSILPKDVPFSRLNQSTGASPVDPGFAAIAGRSKWAIPWLEDDPAMSIPQLWAGRMRRDAADALAYDCDGLIGIHWRTQNLAPNVAALAAAAWNQDGWNPTSGAVMSLVEAEANARKPQRNLSTADFYRDWANAEFGDAVAEKVAAIFSDIDGRLPRPETWINGPGNVVADRSDWAVHSRDFAFVDSLAALRPLVVGKGNTARFDYWLNQMRYLRSVGELACLLGKYDATREKVEKIATREQQKAIARDSLLPIRIDLVDALRETHRLLFAFVSTYGELGNLANWQQHIIDFNFTQPAVALERLLGDTLPAAAQPDRTPVYPPRLIVPELRTTIDRGEDFTLPVIVATAATPRKASLKYRQLGESAYTVVPMQRLNRAVYRAAVPAAQLDGDFEYCVEVATDDGATLVFPPTAPEINQTVVIR